MRKLIIDRTGLRKNTLYITSQVVTKLSVQFSSESAAGTVFPPDE